MLLIANSRAVSNQVLADPHIICRRTKRLRPRLADTCRKEPGLVKELAKGAQQGTKECQFQFRNRRWNCTTAKRSLRIVLMSGERPAICYLFYTAIYIGSDFTLSSTVISHALVTV